MLEIELHKVEEEIEKIAINIKIKKKVKYWQILKKLKLIQ